jgi:hypothetical protein
MEIKKETLNNLKMLVSNIEKLNLLNKNFDELFILKNWKLTDGQLAERVKYKKLKKKYQKQINKIIKNL